MSRKTNDHNMFRNRELSWIDFNKRVLAKALNENTPLLEQAKFSAIFSNNLDEFFMVRVASLKSQVEAGVTKTSDDNKRPDEQLSLAIGRKGQNVKLASTLITLSKKSDTDLSDVNTEAS